MKGLKTFANICFSEIGKDFTGTLSSYFNWSCYFELTLTFVFEISFGSENPRAPNVSLQAVILAKIICLTQDPFVIN